MNKSCVILGAGPSIGLSVAKQFASKGYNLGLGSRNKSNYPEILQLSTIENVDFRQYKVDASIEKQVIDFVAAAEDELGKISIGIYNPSKFVKKSVLALSSQDIEEAWRVSCLGGFIFARELVKRMLDRNKGTIIFTGATAGMRGSKDFAAFAIGKFGLRALAQSMAREFHPKGIHIIWANIDGVVKESNTDESFINPNDIAKYYYQLHSQPKSAWSHEVEVRPWNEHF